jgi:hypothetical protein
MTAQSELHTLAVKVGEISGQLREIVHSQNNMSMKLDGLTEKLLTAPTQADFQKLAARVDALEADKDRNDGAKGVVALIFKNPTVLAILGAIAGAVAAIKGGFVK